MEALAETLGLSTGQLKAIQSAVVVLVVVLLRWVVLRIIHRRIEDPEVWYRARKIATYTATLLMVVFLLRIWLIQFENFATFLGLLSAGVVERERARSPIAKLVEAGNEEYFCLDGNLEIVQQQETLHD
ncbi:MAG: hypothetical protein ACXW15_10960 [Acidimicrobiia bacterium]